MELKAGTIENSSVRGGAATSNGKGEGTGSGAKEHSLSGHRAGAVVARDPQQLPRNSLGCVCDVIFIPQPAFALRFLSLVSSFPSNSGLTTLSNKFLFCLNQLELFSMVAA